MDNFILSICIPTYNRANYLEKTLESITTQTRFQKTNDVEIIISDNCSEDNTKEVSQRFIEKYGKKIKYFRNDENIRDNNFEKVLSYGNGTFLKLNNDTLLHYENTLDEIIDSISQNLSTKNIIFFSNGVLKKIDKTQCIDINSFVKTVSYWSTWIACFGIWKKDFELLSDFSRNSELQLVQTDILLRQISSGRFIYINNTTLFNSLTPESKGGYNIYKVFVTNYNKLLKEYLEKNQISRKTLFNEKTKLMVNFIIPWTMNIFKNKSTYSFKKKGALNIVFTEYRYHPIFYIGFVYLLLKLGFDYIRNKKRIF